MSYMCMGCYEVYDRDLGYCPKPSCYSDVVEIDELMIPTIKMLNEKGFATQYCCSGHVYDNGCAAYIRLHPSLLDVYSEDEVKDMFANLPEGWKFTSDQNGRVSVIYELDYKLKEENVVVAYEEIVNANLSLLKFVEELPWLEY